ncbi:GNAT family N-acetyltransferase [Bacillus sp. LL01]|uniref:GNAT family N-acetyltransferase n=1 Tax=Bacillus sp. LL01 TaxID=1665556 RepID=UPI00069CDBDC|nr:GNAT family N-acetyltransferase [Bacillus sp. LL01]
MKITIYYSYDDIDFAHRKEIEKNFLNSSELSKEWLLFLEKNLCNYEPIYFLGLSESGVEYFCTGFTVKKLNVANYLSGTLKKVFDYLDKMYLNPLKYNVVFIKNPLSNFEGIHSHSTDQLGAFLDQCKRKVYKELKCDSIFVSNVESENLNQKLGEAKFIKIPFYPNTELDTAYDTFDDYLKKLKKKKRWDVKNKIKLFHEYGATIEIVDSDKIDNFSRVLELYNNTAEKGEASPYPINYSEESFHDWAFMGEAYKWIIMKYDKDIIAFALIVEENDVLLFKHVGMDYHHSLPSNAYFNLYYSAIQYAIEKGISKMYCGPTTYETKKSIGCQLIELNSFISIKNWFLQRVISKVLTKAFG